MIPSSIVTPSHPSAIPQRSEDSISSPSNSQQQPSKITPPPSLVPESTLSAASLADGSSSPQKLSSYTLTSSPNSPNSIPSSPAPATPPGSPPLCPPSLNDNEDIENNSINLDSNSSNMTSETSIRPLSNNINNSIIQNTSFSSSSSSSSSTSTSTSTSSTPYSSTSSATSQSIPSDLFSNPSVTSNVPQAGGHSPDSFKPHNNNNIPSSSTDTSASLTSTSSLGTLSTAIPSRHPSPAQQLPPSPPQNPPFNNNEQFQSDQENNNNQTLDQQNYDDLDKDSCEHPLYTPNVLSSILSANPTVFGISASTLASAIDYNYSSPLPEIENIFPWLHGLHPNNITQRMFLNSKRMNFNFDNSIDSANSSFSSEILANPPMIPSSIRGLLVVKIGSPNTPGTLIGSIYPNEILARRNKNDFDFIDMDDISFSKPAEGNFDKNPVYDEDEEFSESNNTDDLLNPSNFAPEFLNLDPQEGISLRNFHIQVSKWGTFSDIVLYVSDEADRNKMMAFAKLISKAQENLRNIHPYLPPYHTYVVEDDIYKFLDESRHIMAIPPPGIPYDEAQIRIRNWDSNFLLHEGIEMSMMSSASLIGEVEENSCGGVWLGNRADYDAHMERVTDYLNRVDQYNQSIKPKREPSVDSSGDVNMTDDERQNDNNASDGDEDLEKQELEEPKINFPNWTLYVKCTANSSIPSLSLLDQYIRDSLSGDLDKDSSDSKWKHDMIEFPSSGSLSIIDKNDQDVFAIISMCKLLYVRSRAIHKGTPSASLIYCNDGYTESSVLALCYLIYSTGVSAPQAWLDLHKKYHRAFFTFKIDAHVVETIAPMLLKYSPAVPGSLYDDNYGAVYMSTTSESNSVGVSLYKQPTDYEYFNSVDSSFDDDDINSPFMPKSCKWFSEFDGSFPSVILPHMYLGSLVHANNAEMLRELGIKRIISVGECLDWVNYEDGDNIFTPSPDSPYQYIDNPYPGISKVLYIRNIQDDGIDPITEFLSTCIEFLDEGYKFGEPTLVHCRVGVSRSATVCIAEVMKRLSVGLPRAYLFVRVRRLNVIIQPHLRFMFELAKWEERHRRCGKGWLREVDWPVLCREISVMNRAYIPDNP